MVLSMKKRTEETSAINGNKLFSFTIHLKPVKVLGLNTVSLNCSLTIYF